MREFYGIKNTRTTFKKDQNNKIGMYNYFQSNLIGTGQSCKVYAGSHDIYEDQRVAIKVYNRIEFKGSLQDKLIQVEVAALRQIHGMNIIKIKDVFKIKNKIYIINELCDEYFKGSQKRMKWNQRIIHDFIKQFIEGYKIIRNQGYIHRNIKPQNLLMKNGVLKIADFKFAIKLNCNFIKQKYNVGSPLFMAPQSLRFNIYSQKTDIWAFGVTIYYLLSGQYPYIGQNESDLISNFISTNIKILDCSLQLWLIIKSCLQIQDSKRITFLQLIKSVNKLTLNQIYISNNNRLYSAAHCNQVKTNMIQQQQKQQLILLLSNQLYYIEFLEKCQRILKKCLKLQAKFKDSLLYLLNFIIRMRLQYLILVKSTDIFHLKIQGQYKDFIANNNSTFNRLFQQLNLLSQKYSKDLHLIDLDFSARLKFFNIKDYSFRQSLILQFQALLRSYIKNLYHKVKQYSTIQQLTINQYEVFLLDFLLSMFQLNIIIIQSNNNAKKLSQKTYLKIIIEGPLVMNMAIYRKIVQKIQQLQLDT